MLTSLGHESSALGVAAAYPGSRSVFVLDAVDAALTSPIEALGLAAGRDGHDHDRRRGPARRVAGEVLAGGGARPWH